MRTPSISSAGHASLLVSDDGLSHHRAMVRLPRSLLPAGLLLSLVAPTTGRADGSHAHFERGRSDHPPAGVTFSAGPAAAPGVSFTSGVRIESHADAPPTRHEVAPARVAEAPSPPVVAPVRAPSRAHATEIREVEQTPVAVEPPPSTCHLAGSVRHIELDAHGMRATQVSLATRGDRVIALVSLARNAPLRAVHQGLQFPEARLVIDDGNHLTVTRTLGVEPDAAIAVAEDARVFVVAYEHLDGAVRVPGAEPSVLVTVLDPSGHVASAPHTIDGTAGLRIDSSVVPFGAGAAVVLGRECITSDGAHGPVTESLFVFDEASGLARAPIALTDAQGDETLSRHRVGLAPSLDGTALRATWSIPSGHDTGVWSAQFDGVTLGVPSRVIDRAAWGTEVSADGTGVLYRSGGEQGLPVGLFYRSFESGSHEVALGAGWDPDVAMVRGTWLVAGVALQGTDGHAIDAIVAAARPGEPLRAVNTPDASEATLGDAIDVEMASTTDGVAVGWIEPAATDPTGASRRLGMARVVCR